VSATAPLPDLVVMVDLSSSGKSTIVRELYRSRSYAVIS